MNTYKEILMMALSLALGVIGAWLLRLYKESVLSTLTELIQKAEITVQGSKMGVKKKMIVLAQLEASGIKFKAWMSTAIDNIVKTLNERSAWLVTQADEKLSKKERKK